MRGLGDGDGCWAEVGHTTKTSNDEVTAKEKGVIFHLSFAISHLALRNQPRLVSLLLGRGQAERAPAEVW